MSALGGQSKSRRLAQTALLTAVGLILFVVEAQIPSPLPGVPGVKLGLSNVVTLFALRLLSKREAGLILLVRILLGSLVTGRLVMIPFSLAGGLLCLLVMALLSPLFGEKQVFLLSMFGALAHNAGQLLVAVFVTGTVGVLVYAPVLLLSGLVTGFFTGQVAQAVLLHLQRAEKQSFIEK